MTPDVGRVTLHREIEGRGPDLVLFHGGAGSIEDLAGIRDRLVARHRVMAFDQRGHGRSPGGDEMTYLAMARDTAAMLDALGVRGADVVGWSDGGIVAMILARDRPELVRRVVAIGSNVDWEPAVGPPFTPEAAAWLASATTAAVPMPSTYEASSATGDGWPETAARYLEMWRKPPGLSLDDLARLEAPTLFLSGDRDIVALEHTLAMYRAVPHSQLGVVPGTTHRLPQEAPAAVAELVERFLAE